MNSARKNLRVLIVEDEFIIADEIATIVTGAGHQVVGPVGSVDDAVVSLNKDRPDFAVIDANLRGRSSSQLVPTLNDLKIPFCICTGYRSDDLRPTFGDVLVIQKPIRALSLVAALDAAAARKATQ